MDSLHSSSVIWDTSLEQIKKFLKSPKRWDIFSSWEYEYRYTANGARWQKQPIWTHWAQLDYLKAPFIITEELSDLFSDDQQKATPNITPEIVKKDKTWLKLQIDNLWNEIVRARQFLESSRDGTISRMTESTEKHIEKTIEKMLEDRKKLIREYNTTEIVPETKKNYPVVPITPNSNIPNSPSEPSNPDESLGENNSPEVPNTPENIPETQKSSENPESPETQKSPETPTDNTPEEKPETEPEKPLAPMPDISKIPTERVVHANISEVRENLQGIARSRAEERLRREYAESGFFGKAKRFFTRAKLLEKYIQEELQILQNQNIFDPNTAHIRSNASDRFQKSNQVLSSTQIQTINTITDSRLDIISNQYVQGEISQEGFQGNFMEFLSEERTSEKIASLRQRGTNILKYLDIEKSWRIFLRDLPNNNNEVKIRVELYISNPQNKKLLEEKLGMRYDTEWEQIIYILTHPESRALIQSQKMNISLDIYTGWEWAYAIKNTDKTDTRSYAFGKWLQRHPVLSSIATGLGITATSLVAGPIGNLISGSLGIGTINGMRRNAEYTDEHAGFEKRITQWTHLKSEIYLTVQRLRRDLMGAIWLKKSWIQFRLKRAEDKLRLHQTQWVTKKWREGTTHRHFGSISALNRKLQSYITEREGFQLSWQNNEQQKLYFRQWIAQWLARLDMWKKTGHNFLKSQNEESMEWDYNILYENLIFSTEKLGISLEDIRNDTDYKKIVEWLLSDYSRADNSFDSKRTQTSLKRWATHGAIYGTSSVVFQWLAGSGLFDITSTVPGTPTITLEGIQVDPAIAADLQKALGAQKYQQFVDHLAQSTTPETLWKTLTTDIFRNATIGNGTKNQIMTFILNATDIQNGITKPELLIEAAKTGLFTDIANHSPRIDHVLGLLNKWGYGHVNKTWLIDALKGIDAGTLQISMLKPMEQTKIAEALWCYVHRDGMSAGSHMWQVFMDKVPGSIIPGTPTTETVLWGDWVRYFAIPTWSNTFLSRLRVPDKNINIFDITKGDNFVDHDGKPIEYPKDQDWWNKDTWKENYREDEDNKKKWEDWDKKTDKGIKKPKVVTRWDKREIDDRDLNPDYPSQHKNKNSSEMTDYMIDKAPVYFGDDFKYFQLYKSGKINRADFSKKLQFSNEHQKKQIEKVLPIYEETLKHAYEAVAGIFKEYELNMERIMPYEKFRKNVQFFTFYEFMADSKTTDVNEAMTTKWYNRLTEGFIAFNTHGLTQKPIEEQVKFIKHVAIHELLHGTAVNNYWEIWIDDSIDFIPRRSWLFMINGKYRERWREINEWIVEMLAYETMLDIFGDEYSKHGDIFYKDERECINTLIEKYGISKQVFVRAAYDRNALKDLARKMEWENRERKWFLTLIMWLMKNDVHATTAFLNGAIFPLQTFQYITTFHKSLLSGNSLNPKVLEYIEVNQSGIRLKK